MKTKNLLMAAMLLGCAATSFSSYPARADDPAQVPMLGSCQASDPYNRDSDYRRWDAWFGDCEKLYSQLPLEHSGQTPLRVACEAAYQNPQFNLRIMSKAEFMNICTNPHPN